MKKMVLGLLFILGCGLLHDQSLIPTSPLNLVYTAYYPSFSQNYLGTNYLGAWMGLPVEDIPWSRITYLVHFANNETVTQTSPYTLVTVNGEGIVQGSVGIDLEYALWDINTAPPGYGYTVSPPVAYPGWSRYQKVLIDSAHAHGVKVLYDVHAVGSGGNTALDYITQDQGRTNTFVNAVVSYVNLRGYDGVQVDWELWSDWSKGSLAQFSRLTTAFRNALGPNKIFIYAPGPFDWTRYDPALDYVVDQYCLQTYAYNPAYYGGSVNANVAWYDTPLHKGTVPTDFGGGALDSRGPLNWVSAGHDPKKISVGIYSGSHVMQNANALYQPYSGLGEGQHKDADQLKTNGGTLAWDNVRKVPYVYGTAINSQGNTWYGQPGVTAGQKFFASFEDSTSIKNKIDWISQQGLGGMMIYNLTSDILDLRYGSNPIVGKTNPVHRWTVAALGASNLPTGFLTANPSVLQIGGGTTTLTWTSNNATSASINQGIGSVALNGSTTKAIIFTLTLTNSYGSQTYSATVTVSGGPPVITGITTSNITSNAATVQWTTNVASNSQVEYGTTTSYGNTTPVDASLPTSHSVTLSGLAADTLYHYRVISTEAAGYQAVSSDQTFTTAPPPPASTIRSDDFNSSSLNTSVWTFVNPLNDATSEILHKTTRNGLLSINIPAGRPHEVWTKGNNAPRVMQSVNDADFEIELKFESALTTKYQIQGVIVEEDSRNYLRLEFHSDGSAIRIYVASFVNGTPTARANRIIADNGVVPIYMRVKRQGILWTQSYSFDGKTWTVAGGFSHTLKVTKVGVFICNEGNPAPAFAGLIDYFHNTASSVVPNTNRTE
jgi:GH18 family chitinase